MNFIPKRILASIQIVAMIAFFIFPLSGYGGYAGECTDANTLKPDTSGNPLEIKGGEVKCIGAGTYNYSLVNIHGTIDKDGKPAAEGKLIFKDAKIDFWAKSILVENGGSLIIGSETEPITNTVTIYLYGKTGDPGITCKTTIPEKSSAPDFVCGVPKDKWKDNGSDEYELPGGVKDKVYAYQKTDLQDISGGEEGSYFGRKVLAVSYGGTLRMFGKKGALYPGLLNSQNTGFLKIASLKKQAKKRDRHLELDRFVDWKPGTRIGLIHKAGKPGLSGIFTIGEITAESGDYHSNITIRESGVNFDPDISKEYMVVALDPSGTSWARLNGTISDKTTSKSLSLDREVDWQENDRIVVTTTDYLPGHSEELTVTKNFGKTVKFNEDIKYPHNGEKYSLDKHAVPDRLTKEGFGIKEVETRAAVALLTRNIRIVSAGDEYGKKELPADSYFGGHTIVRQGFRQYQVQGVEFKQLGQGGRAARMPVNFFLTRQAPDNTFLRDCSINESMTHWIELRGAHNVNLDRNVGYKSIGHGFVLAEGTEINNTLSGNIGIFARAAVDNKQNPRKASGILARLDTMDNLLQEAGDAVHPSVFFIANGYNNFENNMAAGAGTCGACYWVALPVGGLSAKQYRNSDDYDGIQSDGTLSAPLKSFHGNFCSTAQHSLITIGSVGVCPGVVKADGKKANADIIKPISAAEAYFSPSKVTIDKASSMKAGVKKDDCFSIDRDQGKCIAQKCQKENEAFSKCMLANNNDAKKCQKENGILSICKYPCEAAYKNCASVCSMGYTDNCAVTVIDNYTSSFHWASTNVSAIWLRTNWFLVTGSVLSDVLNGGLTMVSGGTYDQVINGYWALTRKSAFIGHTQEGNPYATNAGPISPGSPLKCADQEGFCAIADEGVSYPAENFSVYQRLYNIYDGPVYQETNAFLNIKQTPIDCKLGENEARGNCHSDYIYGSNNRGKGIPIAKEGDNKGKCILPNAAVGWKQPNGFYYPPAFYSRQLFFDNVDLRHFIIIPLFDPGTYRVNEKKVRERYCTYNPTDPKGLFMTDWTDIDRQTELNDIDGTLSGLINTISVNNDEFFSVPMKPDECLSEQTCFQVPYDYVTAVVFPEGAERGRNKAVNWNKPCKTQTECQGVPLYRQLLMKDETKGPEQMAHMMGGETYQRSTMVYNNGVYYIDTSADSSNQFMEGQTYDFFLVYAKDTTRITFQIYVGEGFKDTGDPKNSNLKPIRVNIKRPLRWVINPKHVEREINYQPDIYVAPAEAWNSKWEKTYKDGILTVTMDMTASEFKEDFENAGEENCRPSNFCKWDKNSKKCVYAKDSRNPSPYNGADADKICEWAIKAPECPNGGCYGFQITMPQGFDRKTAVGKRPAPRKYSDNKKDWCLDWEKLKWKTPAGERAQKACDYFNNGVDLPGCN